MKKGEIYKGNNKKVKHRAVFLRVNDDESFIGAVLTHGTSKKYPENILMSPEHFVEGYEFKFDDTYLIGRSFTKPKDWGFFTKVGELTKAGINFVDRHIGNLPSRSWGDHFNS